MKRCLMIVCSKSQLIQAIHIRKTMLTECNVDIVLVTDKFDKAITKRLEEYFDHSWWVKENYYTQKEFIRYAFNPEKALRNKIDKKINLEYTDIFNWDPGWLFYYLVKYENKENTHFKWHLLQDALGNYLVSSVSIFPIEQSRNVFEKLVRLFETKVLGVFPKQYDDEYIWKPELKVVQCSHRTVEVPIVDVNDAEYVAKLNYIFDYDPLIDEDLSDEYLFLDTEPELFYQYTARIIREFSDRIEGKKIALFVHPRYGTELYEDLISYIKIKRGKVPWEMYFINQMTKNKVIFGVYTSALIMGYIACNDATDIYSFSRLIDVKEVDWWTVPYCKAIFEKIASYDSHLHLVENVSDIVLNEKGE